MMRMPPQQRQQRQPQPRRRPPEKVLALPALLLQPLLQPPQMKLLPLQLTLRRFPTKTMSRPGARIVVLPRAENIMFRFIEGKDNHEGRRTYTVNAIMPVNPKKSYSLCTRRLSLALPSEHSALLPPRTLVVIRRGLGSRSTRKTWPIKYCCKVICRLSYTQRPKIAAEPFTQRLASTLVNGRREVLALPAHCTQPP